MNNDILYLANYDKGMWDIYHIVSVFSSLDKKIVEKWVEKFNRILKEYKAFLKTFEDEDGNLPDDHYYNYRKYDSIMEINEAFLTTMEIR